MTDLRTRITDALRTADRRVAGFISYEERADAVIAELGLWQQWSNWHPGYYRWVTDWKADDD
jgi:hypothetical protein